MSYLSSNKIKNDLKTVRLYYKHINKSYYIKNVRYVYNNKTYKYFNLKNCNKKSSDPVDNMYTFYIYTNFLNQINRFKNSYYNKYCNKKRYYIRTYKNKFY